MRGAGLLDGQTHQDKDSRAQFSFYLNLGLEETLPMSVPHACAHTHTFSPTVLSRVLRSLPGLGLG